MKPSRRERMSGVDTAWLRMDVPTNLMVIVGVLMFAGKVSLPAVRRAIESRFLAFGRFRQRAVQDAGGAWWEDDETFDIESHVHSWRSPARPARGNCRRS